MIMAQNNNKKIKQSHLFELLKEDQEPFLLKDYIADRRPRHHHHLKKTNRKPIDLPIPNKTNNDIVSHRKKNPLFQKPSCFSSSHRSPDVTATKKSPLFEFPSPISGKKSPGNNNPILLHIPARTAAMLLEAASRIQNKPMRPNKPKAQKFGLFGSLLRRLTSSQQRRVVTKSNDAVGERKKSTEEVFDCPRPSSSGVWSESCHEEEEKSSTEEEEEESCCSSVDFDSKLVALCEDSEDRFCDQSPFRFVLQRNASLSSSSSGRRTPEFSSPVISPARCRGAIEGQEKGFEEEEDEEKEQFSPVSVLDPPFEDDYDVHDDDDHDHHHEEQANFDMETSFANVQRTKHQLLQKLRRFERLAELDPIELEKRMLEDDDEENDCDDDEEIQDDRECEDYESNASDIEHGDDFVHEILGKSSHHRVPRHMKRLVSDLIAEEMRDQNFVSNDSDEAIAKGVAKRFELWKGVRSNTIDMMVEQDLRDELRGIWKSNNKDQTEETAVDIEISIFGILVDELAQELACFSES